MDNDDPAQPSWDRNSSNASSGSRRNTQTEIENASIQYVSMSEQYLIFGVVLGILGFLVALVPFLIDIAAAIVNSDGKQPWWKAVDVPATVSEMVSKWEEPQGRVFFGFELAAAFCTLLSWYPFKLRHACCNPGDGGCRITFCSLWLCSWASLRQFVPPLGLGLVACVPTVHMSPRKPLPQGSIMLIAIHSLAALLMFGGFLLSEAHVLCIWPLKCRARVLQPKCAEYRLRRASWVVAFIFWFIFTVMQVVFTFVGSIQRRYKILSFILEILAGLTMLFNHWVIWKYAPERSFSTTPQQELIQFAGNPEEEKVCNQVAEGH